MVHHLAQRNKHSAIQEPVIVTMRYRCVCANGEVLALSTVIDLEVGDEIFNFMMQQIIKDVRIEIAQHLKAAETPQTLVAEQETRP